MSEEEKKIQSFKRYIISQENKLEEYYNLDDSDDSYYKDEIQELELTIPLLKYILNLIEKQQEEIENSISKDKIRDKIKEYRIKGRYSYWEEIMALEELLGE